MMSRKLKELSTSEGRRKALRRGRIFSLFLFAGGMGMILYGNASLRHNRASLHWPVVPGVMMQVELHNPPRHSYYVQATYSYIINGTRYVSHQIRLWNPSLRSNLSGDVYAKPFAEAHPANSSVDVHYDPKNPDNAVLIPGADKFTDKLFIRGGCFVVILITCQIIWYRKDYIRSLAQRRDDAAEMRGSARAKEIKPLESEMSSQSFLSYKPACKRKLNCFPDAPAGPPMRQVDQDFNPLRSNNAGFFAGNIGHKADPTSVVLVSWIVKTLRLRQTSKDTFVAHINSMLTQLKVSSCLPRGSSAPTLPLVVVPEDPSYPKKGGKGPACAEARESRREPRQRGWTSLVAKGLQNQ